MEPQELVEFEDLQDLQAPPVLPVPPGREPPAHKGPRVHRAQQDPKVPPAQEPQEQAEPLDQLVLLVPPGQEPQALVVFGDLQEPQEPPDHRVPLV